MSMRGTTFLLLADIRAFWREESIDVISRWLAMEDEDKDDVDSEEAVLREVCTEWVSGQGCIATWLVGLDGDACDAFRGLAETVCVSGSNAISMASSRPFISESSSGRDLWRMAFNSPGRRVRASSTSLSTIATCPIPEVGNDDEFAGRPTGEVGDGPLGGVDICSAVEEAVDVGVEAGVAVVQSPRLAMSEVGNADGVAGRPTGEVVAGPSGNAAGVEGSPTGEVVDGPSGGVEICSTIEEAVAVGAEAGVDVVQPLKLAMSGDDREAKRF